ncbi:MAG: hypothetical protein ACYSRR_05840, partial [Planctomycetota bacterium]
MNKRLILLISIVLLLAAAGSTEAASRTFKNLAGNHLWANASNWVSGLKPAPGDTANIQQPGATPYSDYAEIDAANCSGPDAVDVGYIRIGPVGHDDALLKVTGGELTTTGNSIYIGLGNSGDRTYRAKMLVEGGTIYGSDTALLGIQVGKNWCYDSVYEQTGGDVSVNQLVMLDKLETNGSNCNAYLKGGTLTLRADPLASSAKTGPLYRKTDTCALYMSGGTLILTHSNATSSTIQDYIADGILTTPFVRAKWTIDDITGDVVATVVDYPQGAWNFIPAHGDVVGRYDTTFTWSPGDVNAPIHRVYWSDDKNKVETADPTVLIQENDVNAVTVSPMTLGSYYYLRVDEVDGVSAAVWPGDTLRFRCKEYLVIDDFEGYSVNASITTDWKDYWGGYTLGGSNGASVCITN